MANFAQIARNMLDETAQMPHPSQGGVILGRVVNVQDPEGLSRVEILFPLNADADSSGSTAWAPVSVPFAGADYGAFMIPNVDDVVVVGFLANDVRQPVVLGSVWNGEAQSKETLAGNTVEKWAMTGRNGTRIAIVEENNTPKIEMSTEQGISITISDEGGGTINITTGGSTIALSPSEISLEAATIKMDAATFQLSAPLATMDCALMECSGVVTSQVCQTNTVISTTYTPGAGNML
ncbi:MAG: phage baseplate assembly protein V [Aliishimia sp.]